MWGLSFPDSDTADTFAFSVQGALQALGEQQKKEQEQQRKEQEEQARKEPEEQGRKEHDVHQKDEKDWSPKQERWEAGSQLQVNMCSCEQLTC